MLTPLRERRNVDVTMAGYTKLFGSILDSTVWELAAPIKVVWITMLAMADQDGVVEASVPGLAKRAGVERAYCEQALAMFLAPDPDSRTKDHEGRRIEVVDGGWRLLNHAAYRYKQTPEERNAKTAARMRKMRERAARQAADVTPDVTLVTPSDAPLRGLQKLPQADQIRSRSEADQTRSDAEGDPAPGRNAMGDGEFLILAGFQQRWQAALGDMWPGTGKHSGAVAKLAPWAAEDPARLARSLDGYFACRDPFVVRVRWNLATWLADPGRYVPNDPGDASRFGHDGVRYLTDAEVLGGK